MRSYGINRVLAAGCGVFFLFVGTIDLTLVGCADCGPGGFFDYFQQEEAVVGANAQRAVCLWTESQAKDMGSCLPSFTMEPIRKELAVVDLASLSVAPWPLSPQAFVASDGRLLTIRDAGTNSFEIHDLESGSLLLAFSNVQTDEHPDDARVATPNVLLRYRPDLPEGELKQPVLLNAFAGEMRDVVDVKYRSGWTALSSGHLAYFKEPDQLLIIDLIDWTQTALTTTSLAEYPHLTIVGDRVIWIELQQPDTTAKAIRVYNLTTRLVETVADWNGKPGNSLLTCGEPGLLVYSYSAESGTYTLIPFESDSPSRDVFQTDPYYASSWYMVAFAGPQLLHPSAGGWEILDTRDDSSRTVDVFSYLSEE